VIPAIWSKLSGRRAPDGNLMTHSLDALTTGSICGSEWIMFGLFLGVLEVQHR